VGLVAAPDAETIEAIIDAAFWASLRREESYIPKISLAYLPPEAAVSPLLFEQPLPLAPDKLVKLAPAVERAGIHLGVWRNGQGFYVWGTVRAIPAQSIVVEVAAPGLIVVKHHRGDALAKFINVAVLQGDQIKVIDEHANSLPDCPDLLSSLLGFDSPGSWADSVNLMVQLAVSMRAHRRGGLLLVVPKGSEDWRQSIVQPIAYAVSPPFDELAVLTRREQQFSVVPPGKSGQSGLRSWHEELGRAVDAIAGLTAIDGATILTSEYELLAFGAKITRRRGAGLVEQLTLTEPVVGGMAAVVTPGQLGGTRHLSAAQFIHDQRDALALVASQDGRFTVLAWSPCEGMVHAHRVETLLL
jgi:hypothetical protein